jgi:hypothetical protein
VSVFAFPSSTNGQCGLTLREYFAAKAMVALIPMFTSEKSTIKDLDLQYRLIAHEAFALADKMLEVGGDPS